MPHRLTQQLSTKKVMAERAALLLQQFRNSDVLPLENDTKVVEPTTISQIISFGWILSGSHAASSTCDVGYIPHAVVGLERTIKVTARDEEGELFPHSGEVVEARLSQMGSQEPLTCGKKTSDNGGGFYSISFTAQSAGEHELSVTITNHHIKGYRHPGDNLVLLPLTYMYIQLQLGVYATTL